MIVILSEAKNLRISLLLVLVSRFFVCHSAAQRRNLFLAFAFALASEIGPGFSPDN